MDATTMPLTATANAAHRAFAAGLCVVPPREDGTKAPEADVRGQWGHWRESRPDVAQMRAWYGPRSGVGIISGQVSGDVQALDFDDRPTYAAFLETVEAAGLWHVVERIIDGYCDRTPNDGVRWLVRVPGFVRGRHNVKLARRPKRPGEQRGEHDLVKTLIELPDFAIVAPSNGRVHPSGKPYVRESGDFDGIATTTVEDFRALLDLATSFDEMPKRGAGTDPQSSAAAGRRPGDDYNRRATWPEVLTGWTPVYTRGDTTYWRRPGKQTGISASTNHGGSDLLYVWSTSTPFESERSYDRFGAYAVLEHGGDIQAATRALAARGYGELVRGAPGADGSGPFQGPPTKTTKSEAKTDDGRREDGPLILDPADPLPSARTYVARAATVRGVLALRHHGGVFYGHEPDTGAYAERDEAAIRADLYRFLEEAMRLDKTGSTRPFQPTRARVENVLDALRALTNLPASCAAPCWLQDDPGLDACEILPFRNGLLFIPTRDLLAVTPAFFSLSGLPFDYDVGAREPARWLQFLSDLWPDDDQARDTLQEWFGYLLTPDTRFQKIGMLVGPKRSGKGTIGRVIRRLLGERNVCAPTLAGLAEPFGESVLLNKTVAIIADARISARTDTAVITERLLAISGEDTRSVPRKFLPDWTGTLSTRFLLLTNELPRIEDASGALASRFVVLTLNRSFYGHEDHHLFERFVPELPGILNWALDGRDRLYARGRFVQPRSSADLIQEFEDLGSPIGAFVRERCELGSGREVSMSDLFAGWKAWCQETGREKPGTVQTFGRNLRAAFPWLKGTQHRDLGVPIRYWAGLRLRH